MGAIKQDVYYTNDLLSDQEVLLYLNELDKYQSELKGIKKDMRNADADSLNKLYLNKMILINKCKYYQEILSMVPESQKKNVLNSRPNYELQTSCNLEAKDDEGKRSIWDKLIDRYFEKKVNDYISYLH